MAKEFTLEQALSAPANVKEFGLDAALGKAPTIERPDLGSPMGDESGASIMAAAGTQPRRESVLQDVYMPEPPFNPAEAEKLSRRAYAEQKPVESYGEIKASPAKNSPIDIARGLATGLREDLGKAVSVPVRGLGNFIATESIGNKELQEQGKGIEELGAKMYRKSALEEQRNQPTFETSTGAGLYSGARSLEQMLAAFAATGGNAPATLGLMSGMSGLEASGQALEKGKNYFEAGTYGLAQGALEYATEKMPLGYLASKLGKEGFKQFLGGFLLRELPSEQIATITQDALEKAVLKPETTWTDYLKERPEAAYQTLLATGVMTGGVGAIHGGAKYIAEKQRDTLAEEAKNAALDKWKTAFGPKIERPAKIEDLIESTKPAPQAETPATTPETIAQPTPAQTVTQKRRAEQQMVTDLEREVEGTIPQETVTPEPVTVAVPEATPTKPKAEEDYANKTLEELQTLRDNASQTNDALDLAAIQKHFGSEVAAEYEKMNRRQRNKWWDENATEALDRDSSTFNGVDEDLLDEYIKAHNDFDTESPRALGKSVGLLARKINDSGFIGSPDFVRLKNALAYANQQGWSEKEVLDGMRERATEWAGADAQELFKDLFKAKPVATPGKTLSITGEDLKNQEMFEPRSAAEDMQGEPVPMPPEVEAELGKLTKDQEAAIAEREKLEKRTAGSSLMQVLKGTLNDNELSELGGRARRVGKNQFLNLKASKGQAGSSMEDMVDSGKLDIFLPENMRPDHPDYVNSESAEYIRDKLRNNQFYTYDTELEIKRINQDIESLERQIQDLLSDDEINKELQYAANEQRELDQATEEPAATGANGTAEQRETKATDDELTKREAQLDRETALNEREAKLLEERKRLEEERLKLESPTKKDVTEQEERKAKAADLDEREQIRKESEAGAGQFELTREEGRQDTTGGLFEQPVAEPEPEPKPAEVSVEEERKTALKQLKAKLAIPIPPFRASSANKTQLLKPAPLTAAQIKEIIKLASDALDLGLPPAVLGNVTAAGRTRMDVTAVMSATGWLMTAKNWSSALPAEKLQVLIHELAHAVDTAGGKISTSASWTKAHAELQNWYASSANKVRHPLAYPFAPQYKGRVRPKEESFAQAFAFYFTSPVDLQKNAPEAYSQIQSIVERIQNESQAARAAGSAKTGTAGIKVQPSRTGEGAASQPVAREVSPAVGATQGPEDRGAAGVKAGSGAEMFDQQEIEKNRTPEYKSRTKLIEMPIKDFLSLSDDGTTEYKTEGVQKLVKEGKKFSSLPFLIIDRDGRVEGHEGRHRARALMDAGYTTMPVILRSANIRWSEQDSPDRFDYVEEWPTKMQAQMDAANPNFSVPFPVTRENSASDYEPGAIDINMSQAAPQTETPAFKRWFGDSKVIDADGKPRVMYRGEQKGSTYFASGKPARPNQPIFVSPSTDLANEFAVGKKAGPGRHYGAFVTPVYVKAENPFDYENPNHIKQLANHLDALDEDVLEDLLAETNNDTKQDFLREISFDEHENWSALEMPQVWNWVQKNFDSAYVGENGVKNLAVFSPGQIKSAIGNNGQFDSNLIDINASIGQNIFDQKPLVAWGTPTESKMDEAIYYLQNKQIDMKRVVDEIAKSIGSIDDRWNPYLMEELFHGRSAKQTRDFLKNELRPLLQEMQRNNVTTDELEEYLHNRHAEERNDQIAKINPNMPDGGSGIDTADARAYLAALTPEQKKVYDDLARMVDTITKGTRQLMVDSGLESQDTIDQWEQTYGSYIPLNREDIDYSSSHGMSVGQGYSVRGSASRRATGSSRQVVDILANIAMQRERTIVRAEKNRVATALYGLAIKNPNPEFWLAVNPESKTNITGVQNELVNMGMTLQDAQGLMNEPSQKIVDPKTGLVTERVNPILRGADNVLAVRVNGKDRYVFFNQNNPRAERMAKALKNLDADQLGIVLSNMAKFTRYFASINTQFNPVFGIINFKRDLQSAMLQLSTTEIAGKGSEVVSHVLPAIAGIYKDLRAERNGKVGRGQWSRLWDEFQQEGGQTGFRDQFSRSEERAQALERELKAMSEGKVKKAGRAVFDWLSDYNETLENAVRLSAYKVALDQGLSKEKAASIAKNLTVNFNRKGQIATQASALYAFFNAAVQGTTRLAQTMRGPMGKTIFLGGATLGSLQAIGLMMAGFGDDDPPEFVKNKNFIIPLMNGKYLAIPMPLGYNVIPSTFRILTEGAIDVANGKPAKAAKRISDITGLWLDAFNPIGNAGWSVQTIAPTLADPLVALTENKDWTGKPIAKKDFNSLDPTPGYLRAKETASSLGKWVSEALNTASGGTKYKPGVISPTPDQIDYLVGQATGGIGREVLKAEQTIRSKVTGEELPPHKIPLVGRFYGDTKGSSSVSSKFYSNLEELNMHENEVKGRAKNRENVQGYLRENPEARLYEMANKVERNVQQLRKLRHDLVEKGAPKERVQAIEANITRQMKSLNDRFEAAQEKRK